MNNINQLFASYQDKLDQKFRSISKNIALIEPYQIEGKVSSVISNMITSCLPGVMIGDMCQVYDSNISILAEVVAIDGKCVKLLPYDEVSGISQNTKIRKYGNGFNIGVSNGLIGKIVNGFGNVIADMQNQVGDSSSDIVAVKKVPIAATAPDPMERLIIDDKLITGITAIDMFITCAKGQRVGVFAGPGMGKTTLMGMIIRNTDADVVVVCLIGERGREVKEFVELELNQEIRKKCILVVATSDRPPVEQIKCPFVAQTIAEHFRNQGKNVLLFVDSITRFARAQREVGLSAGEPITRGGYPPSVFMAFPKLMERAGKTKEGTITALYTVLMEGEDIQEDPIADEIKSIIDGHIILSRKLAETGHFPAINILSSLSRVADRVISKQQLDAARHIRLLISRYLELEFILRVGEYKQGQNPIDDEAIAKHEEIKHFLIQNPTDKTNFDSMLNKLVNIASKG